MPQTFHHRGEGRLFNVISSDPTQPYTKRNEIGAHGWFRLRPDPPSRPVVAAVTLGIGSREGGLANTPQSVQSRDGDPAMVASERRLDRRQRVIAPHEMEGHADRDVESGEPISGPQIAIWFKRCWGDRPYHHALSDRVRMPEFEPPLGTTTLVSEQNALKSSRFLSGDVRCSSNNGLFGVGHRWHPQVAWCSTSVPPGQFFRPAACHAANASQAVAQSSIWRGRRKFLRSAFGKLP